MGHELFIPLTILEWNVKAQPSFNEVGARFKVIKIVAFCFQKKNVIFFCRSFFLRPDHFLLLRPEQFVARVFILNIECLLVMFLFPILWPGAATNVGLFILLTVAFVLAIDQEKFWCLDVELSWFLLGLSFLSLKAPWKF